MARPRRSYGHQHRPDWEQRLCRVDAALADGDLSPAEARERYRALGLVRANEATGDADADDDALPDAGEPSPP